MMQIVFLMEKMTQLNKIPKKNCQGKDCLGGKMKKNQEKNKENRLKIKKKRLKRQFYKVKRNLQLIQKKPYLGTALQS